MALVKPIVNEIVAFDATVGTTVTFTANGGDQVTKNEIKVVTNDENEVVKYQNTVTSYDLSHVIPANTLTNGQYYKVAIRTYDVLNNTSAWSNYQPFYCYKTPVIALNITDGQTITTSTYRATLTYTQAQNEKLDYALIEVYNQNHTLMGTSGNLYSTDFPPITFNYDIIGLVDNSQYYIVASVVTINGTIVKTNEIRFYTDFNTIVEHSTLTATLDSCNGYVNLHSSIVSKIGGISNPTELTYINGNRFLDLRNAVADFDIENSYWAKWDKLLTIPTDFLLRLWFYPARQPFKIIELSNELGFYMTISHKRGTTTDYLSIRTDNGTTKDVALGLHCNGNTRVFLWIKVVGDSWDVQFNVLSDIATVLEWNSIHNNLPYNVTSDMVYVGESYENFTPASDNFEEISGVFTSVIIGNGIFDHLNITKDTSITYTEDIPIWDEENTLLDITFNGNINNTSPNYTKLVLKRKDDTLLNWLNLSEVEVDYNKDVYIDFNDSYIPTGVKQEYALVVYIDDIPSEYHTVDITPIWSKYFLSDKTNRFVLNAAVIYSNQMQNIQNGVLMPIGAKYPIVIQNGEGNYASGSVQFKVLGYQYDIDKRLDRISITKQKDDILTFLTNGKAKCLTDFNGNIYILKVINSPQISYDSNWGNGIVTISFDWVEQGKYNNYEDMLELVLFDYVATE